MEGPEEQNEEQMIEEDDKNLKVWMPGMALEEDEQLEADPSAYLMLHTMNTEWPCLSFDIAADSLGSERVTFPMSCTVVAGTCADKSSQNKVLVMEWNSIERTGGYDTDSEPSDEEEDEDAMIPEPKINCQEIPHDGAVNRLRCTGVFPETTIATFSEKGNVNIFHRSALIFSSAKKAHKTEGFGLAWSPTERNLLSGDNNGALCLHEARESHFTTTTYFMGHTASIEDINWSPAEASVFATASADGCVRIYDTRSQNAVLEKQIAQTDINVLSWNKAAPNLLASGLEDGSFVVHDMRNWKDPMVSFSWHKSAITSVEWHPTEASVLAVAGDDDHITLWDFAAERDEENPSDEQVPHQLLFIHAGQTEIREVHWHPQLPGTLVSTAASGLNVFKTISI